MLSFFKDAFLPDVLVKVDRLFKAGSIKPKTVGYRWTSLISHLLPGTDLKTQSIQILYFYIKTKKGNTSAYKYTVLKDNDEEVLALLGGGYFWVRKNLPTKVIDKAIVPNPTYSEYYLHHDEYWQ